MKACMVLQRRFAYVGNEIASLLKERHDVSEFCGYVSTRESYDFLVQQKDVAYGSLLLDEDVHEEYHAEIIDWEFLTMLEREYGIPNLWPYIENDRIVRHGQLIREYPHNTPPYSHEEMLRMVQATAKKILAFFDKEKPDFVVYSVVGGLGGMLLYHIAKKKGIRTLVIVATRTGVRQIVSEHYSLFTGLTTTEDLTDVDREKARTFLRMFRESPVPYTDLDSIQLKAPSRSRHFNFLVPYNIFTSIRFQIGMWKSYIERSHKNDYTIIRPWYLLWDKMKRKTRILIGYDDLYDPPSETEAYAFYPLQLEPEISTMLYAPDFMDQVWVAKLIAKSLPVGYKLYVKEHLAMFGYRTRNFYKELKKIPNLRLINPNVVSYTLITNAALITTITSTVGWEAIALKKPVITFGDVFYNALPFVHTCSTPSELPQIIKKQLDSSTHDEDALVDFIASIIRSSVEVDMTDIWEKQRSSRVRERRKELAPLADLIFSKATEAPRT